MHLDPHELQKFLVDSGLVSKRDVEAALLESVKNHKELSEVLINQGKINEDDFRKVTSYLLGIPFVDLAKERVPKETLGLIPEPIARKHNIVAYKKTDDGLEVAMLDPLDLEAIDFVRKGLGVKILPRLTNVASIKQVLLQYQKSLKAEFGDLIRADAAKLTRTDDTPEAEKKLAEDVPVVRMVDTLISHAIIQKASDIHLEPFEQELVVRYRIDGLLHDAMILPKEVNQAIVARIKVLAGLRLDEKRLPQDGRFKLELAGQNVSFRVSLLPTYYGEKVVMRLLPDSVRGFTLESLGFHGESLERIHKAARAATGMILATGPTGSGKTTTLYTALELLNTPDVNISTVEDPIEYQIPRINQTQVKPDIGLTFANGLRSLVRQDPDIIMVGEIRDEETANLAINAALTGHLVLSTLHTNSAAGAIPRLLDMKVEPFLLVSTINVVIAQRLVRRLVAKTPYKLSQTELTELSENVDLPRLLDLLKKEKIVATTATWSTIDFFKPQPSTDSADGYADRIGIHEVLPMSTAIKELVIKSATADEIERQAKSEGMMTMLEDGMFKAVQGLTTIEEVLRVVTE